MPAQKNSYRISLTAKFFLWSMAIILVFGVTAGVLFMKISSMVQESSTIVQTHYRTVELSESLIDQLLNVTESKKRFEILEKLEDRFRFLSELRQFQSNLKAYLLHPGVQATLESLEMELPPRIMAGHPSGGLTLREESANRWLDFFSAVRDDHRGQMAQRLQNLESSGTEAFQAGLLGLALCAVIVVSGSAILIVRMSRSTRELKKGLQRVGHGDELEPVRVVSHDELGDLSIMFNDMIQRLKKEDEKRADFISMLSHEIRTPLTSIRESLSLIQDEVFGPVTGKQAHFLQVSSQEVERLSSFLNRLLLASSMDEQGLALNHGAVNVHDLVLEALERLQPNAQARGVEIQVEDQTGNMEVRVDKDHLQQVMVNLVGNAVKFSPERGVVQVTIESSHVRGEVVTVTVSDQGPGIPEGDRPFVFDRFYRGEGIRTKVDGSGLGLNITRRIIAAHGGDVWFHDDVHEGAALSFTLPVGGRS